MAEPGKTIHQLIVMIVCSCCVWTPIVAIFVIVRETDVGRETNSKAIEFGNSIQLSYNSCGRTTVVCSDV